VPPILAVHFAVCTCFSMSPIAPWIILKSHWHTIQKANVSLCHNVTSGCPLTHNCSTAWYWTDIHYQMVNLTMHCAQDCKEVISDAYCNPFNRLHASLKANNFVHLRGRKADYLHLWPRRWEKVQNAENMHQSEKVRRSVSDAIYACILLLQSW